jgi:hypothetical protein
MVWIEKVCSINSEKIDVLPMFSRTVGEMVNVVIEDHMSIVTDLAKSMGPFNSKGGYESGQCGLFRRL